MEPTHSSVVICDPHCYQFYWIATAEGNEGCCSYLHYQYGRKP